MTTIFPRTFRLRSRHLAIMVTFLAILVGILMPLAPVLGRLGLLSPRLVLFIAAPWVLGLLVLLIERKSPVKFWAAPLLVSLSAPALVLWLNSVVVLGSNRMPSGSALLALLFVNTVLIGRFTLYLRDMCPRCCPDCQTRSMIPLRKLLGAEPRLRNTFWCGSCGGTYWRAMTGEWRKERRQTWVDVAKPSFSATAGEEHRRFESDSRVIAPVIRTCGKPKVRRPGAPSNLARDTAELVTVQVGVDGSPD
jgi:hypothetical protein